MLAENKQKVLDEKKRLEEKGITGPALDKALSKIAAKDRKQELFNTSGFTFEKLLRGLARRNRAEPFVCFGDNGIIDASSTGVVE